MKERNEILKNPAQTEKPSRDPKAPATEKAPVQDSGDKTLERNDKFIEPAERGAL